MSRAKVGRWGKSLAVRLSGEIARSSGFRDGEPVEIEARDGNIVIRHAAPSFKLAELFKGTTPAQWRAEYAPAFGSRPTVRNELA